MLVSRTECETGRTTSSHRHFDTRRLLGGPALRLVTARERPGVYWKGLLGGRRRPKPQAAGQHLLGREEILDIIESREPGLRRRQSKGFGKLPVHKRNGPENNRLKAFRILEL